MKERTKIYIVSGLGADFKVLERIKFPENVEPIFLNWLIPEKNENFADYVKKMADRIDDSEKFHLLGYSFGGLLVQEIDKIKPAEKVVILGSIKSSAEKSKIIKAGEFTGLPKFFPEKMFSEKPAQFYGKVRNFIDPKNPKILEFFQVKDPYYLKWSVEKVAGWKFEPNGKTIQILGDKDIVFPIKYSKPDFVIKGGTHLFPATKHKEVSKILAEIFSENI